MINKYKIGILRETKNPPDRRVAVTPKSAIELLKKYPQVELRVQPSPIRCFTDQEYRDAGIILQEDLSDCVILIGVKEVKYETFIPKKKYLFFAHVAKLQAYNKQMFKEMISQQITLMDYEYLTDNNNMRLVAFGHWAGIVGAYNSLLGFGKKYNLYELKRAKDCFDYQELRLQLVNIKLSPIKILVTGKGRVGTGAKEILDASSITQVNTEDFLRKTFDYPVYCQIDADEYAIHKENRNFSFPHFFKHPEEYVSNFKRFMHAADLYIACHFWDKNAPIMLGKEEICDNQCAIKFIGDVSCDINGPIITTTHASTIDSPYYDFNTYKMSEEPPFSSPKNITTMTVDNLPGELPRDASEFFANTLLNNVIDYIINHDTEEVVKRATILENGNITERYNYLHDFAK